MIVRSSYFDSGISWADGTPSSCWVGPRELLYLLYGYMKWTMWCALLSVYFHLSFMLRNKSPRSEFWLCPYTRRPTVISFLMIFDFATQRFSQQTGRCPCHNRKFGWIVWNFQTNYRDKYKLMIRVPLYLEWFTGQLLMYWLWSLFMLRNGFVAEIWIT